MTTFTVGDLQLIRKPGGAVTSLYTQCWKHQRNRGGPTGMRETLRRLDQNDLLRDTVATQYTSEDLTATGESLALRHATQLNLYRGTRLAYPRANAMYSAKMIEAAMEDCGYVLTDELRIDNIVNAPAPRPQAAAAQPAVAPFSSEKVSKSGGGGESSSSGKKRSRSPEQAPSSEEVKKVKKEVPALPAQPAQPVAAPHVPFPFPTDYIDGKWVIVLE
jgi:hypothetical protein